MVRSLAVQCVCDSTTDGRAGNDFHMLRITVASVTFVSARKTDTEEINSIFLPCGGEGVINLATKQPPRRLVSFERHKD